MTGADVGKRRSAAGRRAATDARPDHVADSARVTASDRSARAARIAAELDELANDGLLGDDDQDVDLPAVWGRAPSRAARELAESENLKKAFLTRRAVLQASVSRGQAAALLGLSEQAVTKHLEQGRIIGIKDRGRWAIPAWQLDADTRDGYLDGHRPARPGLPRRPGRAHPVGDPARGGLRRPHPPGPARQEPGRRGGPGGSGADREGLVRPLAPPVPLLSSGGKSYFWVRGSRRWRWCRVYHREARTPRGDTARTFGPLARFDPHTPDPAHPAVDPAGRSVLYVGDGLATSACEVFGETGEALICPGGSRCSSRSPGNGCWTWSGPAARWPSVPSRH
jgi:hypothetical protein